MELSHVRLVTIFRNILDKHFPKIHLTLMKTCEFVYSFKKLRKELLSLTFLLRSGRPADASKGLKFAENVELNLQVLLFP